MTAATSKPIVIGPIVVNAMYCWLQNSEYTIRLGVENLIDEPVIVMTEHGPMKLDSGQRTMTDPLLVSDRSECAYTIAVEFLHSTPRPVFDQDNIGSQLSATSTKSEFATTTRRLTYSELSQLSPTAKLPSYFHTEVIRGVEFDAGNEAINDRFDQLYVDLENADLDSLETYVEALQGSRLDLVALIAWREFIRPVRLEVHECQPTFSYDSVATSTPLVIGATQGVNVSPRAWHTLTGTWECDVVLRYATYRNGPGSGIWEVKAVRSFSEDEFILQSLYQPSN